MVDSIRAQKIGVIAEEKNDVDVLYELTCKVVKENHFSFSHFIGHGCGKVRRKCRVWGQNLVDRGCSHIVVVHDLDRRDAKALRSELEREIAGLKLGQRLVLIPVREIEAWLLCDPNALKVVFGMKRLPRAPKSPESVLNPKEVLANLVWQSGKAQYLNTVHNQRIAARLAIKSLTRCPSFAPYQEFLSAVFPRATSRVG